MLWADLIRPVAASNLSMKIFKPSGAILFYKNFKIKKSQAMALRYGGKKRKKNSWPTGVYLGELILTIFNRNGELKSQKITTKVVIK